MEPYVWQVALGAVSLGALSVLYAFYEGRRFDRRFGKDADRKG